MTDKNEREACLLFLEYELPGLSRNARARVADVILAERKASEGRPKPTKKEREHCQAAAATFGNQVAYKPPTELELIELLLAERAQARAQKDAELVKWRKSTEANVRAECGVTAAQLHDRYVAEMGAAVQAERERCLAIVRTSGDWWEQAARRIESGEKP